MIMALQYPQMVEPVKPTFRGLHAHSQNGYFTPMGSEAYQYVDIGARLKAIRAAFSVLGQREWADRNGFNFSQYNNWERGERRIPVESAEKLCETYGLTLDFIYRGRRDGLSERAANSL